MLVTIERQSQRNCRFIETRHPTTGGKRGAKSANLKWERSGRAGQLTVNRRAVTSKISFILA